MVLDSRAVRGLTVVAADERVLVIGLNALRAFRLRRANICSQLCSNRSQQNWGVRTQSLATMFEEEEALFRLGRLPGEQLPDIAVAMLDAGFDAQPVRELAALRAPTLRDAGELFEAALASLGRPPLTLDQAATALRNRALRRTGTGEVSPLVGAREIMDAWYALDCPSELSVFVDLDDLWYENPEKRSEIEQEIVDRAYALMPRVPDESAS